HAQGPGARGYNSSSDLVVVNDATAAASSVYVLDSMKSIHIAIFEVSLTGDESRKIWSYLLGAALGGQPARLALFKVNAVNGQTMEQRTFKLFAITELT